MGTRSAKRLFLERAGIDSGGKRPERLGVPSPVPVSCRQEREPMQTDRRTPVMTGGCQCGAVRYALMSEPTQASICHCRMCQKAFGSYFAPLTGVPVRDLVWTRGTPAFSRVRKPQSGASAGIAGRRSPSATWRATASMFPSAASTSRGAFVRRSNSASRAASPLSRPSTPSPASARRTTRRRRISRRGGRASTRTTIKPVVP